MPDDIGPFSRESPAEGPTLGILIILMSCSSTRAPTCKSFAATITSTPGFNARAGPGLQGPIDINTDKETQRERQDSDHQQACAVHTAPLETKTLTRRKALRCGLVVHSVCLLLDGTGDRGEDVIGVGTN